MLQQTSVARVRGHWSSFLTRFPTPASCADAPLADVLVAWQGLGYPRRAKALHDTARTVCEEFGGVVPRDVADLRRLPGVGEYTASAVASFAYGEPVAILDTNVGRVLARALANRTLSRREARELADDLRPRTDVASFNQAMLDLGAQFCRATPRCETCPMARNCVWHRDGGPDPAPRSAGVSRAQAPYAGSDRELRGRVLRFLSDGPRSDEHIAELCRDLSDDRRRRVVSGLVNDGLVARGVGHYALAER